MNSKKCILTAVVVFLVIGTALPVLGADVKGRLFVEVKDLKGKPIKDVKITIVSEVTDSKTYELTTDKKGKAMIVGIDPDSYKYRCEKDGAMLLIYKVDEKEVEQGVLQDNRVKLRPGTNVRETWTLVTEEEAKEIKIEKLLNEMTPEERNKIFAEEAHNKGVTALENNDMAEAKAQFEKAIELDPDVHYFSYLLLGQMAFNDHDLDKALTYLLKAKELDTDKAAVGDIGSLLGATYLIQEKTDLAKEVWSEVVNEQPDATVLYNLAGIEVRAGNLDEAKKWLEISIENFPNDINSLQLLGDIYIQKPDYPNALKMYEKLEKAMEASEGISPEALKEVKDTVKLLKETVK